MVLSELALQVINDPESFKYEDLVEAYQFVNDNGLTGKLNPAQTVFLFTLVESNQISTDPFRG